MSNRTKSIYVYRDRWIVMHITICTIESTFKSINIYIDTEKAYERYKKTQTLQFSPSVWRYDLNNDKSSILRCTVWACIYFWKFRLMLFVRKVDSHLCVLLYFSKEQRLLHINLMQHNINGRKIVTKTLWPNLNLTPAKPWSQ